MTGPAAAGPCQAASIPPWLAHIDEAWLVIDKPAGLPSVPGRPQALHDCAASRAQALWPDALVVHRLDMATSGLLLMARGAGNQRLLSDAFAQRQVEKRYVAVVTGELRDDAGCIELPLAADWPNRPRQKVDLERGKTAVTHWRVAARGPGFTRVELQPVTGRTHQLRVHLAAIGHPIAGDSLYAQAASSAPPCPSAQAPAGPEAPRLLLHAARLALAHPVSALPFAFESAPPF